MICKQHLEKKKVWEKYCCPKFPAFNLRYERTCFQEHFGEAVWKTLGEKHSSCIRFHRCIVFQQFSALAFWKHCCISVLHLWTNMFWKNTSEKEFEEHIKYCHFQLYFYKHNVSQCVFSYFIFLHFLLVMKWYQYACRWFKVWPFKNVNCQDMHIKNTLAIFTTKKFSSFQQKHFHNWNIIFTTETI